MKEFEAMRIQQTLSFDLGGPFEILDSQPSPDGSQARLAKAHALCDGFRRAKAQKPHAPQAIDSLSKGHA